MPEILEETLPTTEEPPSVEEKPQPMKPTPKPIGRPPKKVPPPPAEEAPVSRRREPGEDFFDYLARLPQDCFSSGIYIYKQARTGNVQIDRVYRSINFDDLKNTYAGQNGPGNYLVQFTTRDKTLTPCSQRYTFDGSTLSSLGDGSAGSLGDSVATTSAQATSEAIRMVAEASREANKANIELITDITKNAVKPEKGIDVAALITGIATLMPKQDNTMVQFMIQEANRRADAAEKDADRRERQAKEEADRRERDAERRAAEAKAEADRQRERDKEFFGLILKQAEAKADSLNQMTGLLTSFMKVKETIDDTMGGGPKGPWDVVGNVIDGVIQQGPAIMAAVKGASPQQVQQMQQQANPQAERAEAQPFYEMIHRLAKYFARDPALYDGPYLIQMMEEEYGGLYADIINQPKETVLAAITAFEPYGKSIMEHAQAGPFMSKVVDAIKFPDTMDDIFGGNEEEDEEPPIENPPMVMHRPRGRPRKLNGQAKTAQAG